MPRRTNDFQELVSLIQQVLMPTGAKVTESAMIETTDGRTAREIDVLIDSAIGPYRIRIAVEAKKESRKMDEARFDAIVGKYLQDGGVRVNKVVVVAYAGFTQGVIERATLLDIELVTLREAESIDWSRLRPPEACMQSAVDLTDIEFDADALAAFGGSVPNDAQIICSCGWRYGTPHNYARHVFWNKVLRESRADLLRFDNEVMTTSADKKLRIATRPHEPHQLFLSHGEARVAVSEFAFKVRLFKLPEVPSPFTGQIGFSHSPHVCTVEFAPRIEGIDARQMLDSAIIKCSCCGRNHGTVRQWAHEVALSKFLNRNEEAQKLLLGGLKQSPDGNAHLIASWPFPGKLRVHVADAEYSPESVKIDIHAVAAKGTMEHKQYELSRPDGTTSVVDSFEGVVGGKRLRMVMPDGLSSKKVVLRIDNAGEAAVQHPVDPPPEARETNF